MVATGRFAKGRGDCGVVPVMTVLFLFASVSVGGHRDC